MKRNVTPRAAAAALLLLAAAAALAAGCGNNTANTAAVPTPSVVPGGPVGPVTGIPANNPPAGQPNHMSPEMQAQLQRYQAYKAQSSSGGSAAAAAPKP